MPRFNEGHSGNGGWKVVDAIEGLSYGPTTLYPYFLVAFCFIWKDAYVHKFMYSTHHTYCKYFAGGATYITNLGFFFLPFGQNIFSIAHLYLYMLEDIFVLLKR